jgi:tetratricopeptide (TPR) repeat protein
MYASASAKIGAQLSIVENALAVGSRSFAARHLIQALWRARRCADEASNSAAIGANSKVAAWALKFVAPRSSRLVHTLTEQMRQLVLEQGADGYIDTLLEQAEVLGHNGDPDGALQRLELAMSVAEKEMPARVWDIRVEQAILAADLARPGAGDECITLASDPRTLEDLGVRGRCLISASDAFKAIGSYREALSCNEQAQEVWREMGHANAMALTRAMRADVLRCLGDIQGAERELQSVKSISDPEHRGWILEFRARLMAAKGDTSRGADLAANAMRIALDLDDRVTAIARGVLTCEFHERGRAYAPLEKLQATVNGWVRDQVAYLSYRRTHDAQLADEHAARAVRILITGLGPSSGRRRSARDHLEEAIRLDAEVCWYHLELGLLEALEGRAAQVRPHVRTAMETTSDADLRAAMEEFLTGV